MAGLHGRDADVGDLARRASSFVADRLAAAPLGRTASPADMQRALGDAISPAGIGPDDAWRLLTDAVLANTVGIDSERFLAFVPVSPSVAATWADAIVGATSVAAESWLEAAGAVAAENQVLRWLAGLAGQPPSAGGCFMSGGSIGNLSALAVARDRDPSRRIVAIADTAHASIGNTLRLLDMRPLVVPAEADGRLSGAAVRSAMVAQGLRVGDLAAVVGSAGSTNAGVIDDLDGLADVADEFGAWFHVDAAYGGAALVLPEFDRRLAAMGRADSFIVDPHKWLFAPSGSCALIFREPSAAAAVHTQHGPYVDVFRQDGDEWNPSDYGYQLTRRASGLPLWFSLVLHGTDVYATAIRRGIELAAGAASAISATDVASVVMAPELSVVLFRRAGWGADEWRRWARRLLDDGIAFVAPTTWRGEAVGRLIFMHPSTSTTVIDELVATLR